MKNKYQGLMNEFVRLSVSICSRKLGLEFHKLEGMQNMANPIGMRTSLRMHAKLEQQTIGPQYAHAHALRACLFLIASGLRISVSILHT